MDDNYPTHTSRVQLECQQRCADQYTTTTTHPSHEDDNVGLLDDNNLLQLLRAKHVRYSQAGLFGLKGYMKVLDASRPWLIYWMLHSLALLDALPDDPDFDARVVSTLSHMARKQTCRGGYGGGPQQLPHCAPTYAAILALLTVGTEEAYRSIDRRRVYQFFMSMKQSNGAFTMHQDGETDTRAAYTVLCVASLLNIMTPELCAHTGAWIASCQTFEGGFGAEPFNEAHGGYAFCAVAVLELLNAFSLMNVPAMLRWVTLKQMSQEGGFQGRTNKLVDSCYSFWQGSIPAVLMLGTKGELVAEDRYKMKGLLMMDQEKLQHYLLGCCQQTNGGMRDKPGKSRDNYHTCYALSGLSVAQQYGGGGAGDGDDGEAATIVVGNSNNRLQPTHPVYNLRLDKVAQARAFFYEQAVEGGTAHSALMEVKAEGVEDVMV